MTLQAEGKSLLFKCEAVKLPASASSGGGTAAPAAPENAEVMDGRVVFDEKNVTLFKHEAGPLLKLSLGKSAANSIALKDPRAPRTCWCSGTAGARTSSRWRTGCAATCAW